MNCFQPAQMMSRSSKVSMTSMPTCPLHRLSISPPAPFHSLTKQTHVITRLFTCLKYASLSSGYYGTKETSYFEVWGWAKGISSSSRSGARRFSLQIVAILSTFWHACELKISQYQVNFYTLLKIGPCYKNHQFTCNDVITHGSWCETPCIIEKAWNHYSSNSLECHKDYHNLCCHFYHCHFRFWVVLSHYEPLKCFKLVWAGFFLCRFERVWSVFSQASQEASSLCRSPPPLSWWRFAILSTF